ncbi:MAG: YidC/Oxa1 family membrane protein insertase [Actinomycetota bacterium]|nr:YidC/Oxa1 family membrane protein insertase [Actinomycetota bacterium]
MTYLGDLFKPIFELLAGLIAIYYGLVHSYAGAIALLTVTVMAVVWPLTQMSTRSMLEMQRLQPELKALQAKYKNDRVKQNEEMQRLFKENKVSPASGCLPMLLQFPLLFVMYDVIRGLTNIQKNGTPAPKYISHTTLLYKNLVAGGGKMHSLGIDLGTAATHVHSGFLTALPYYGVVIIAVVLVFISTWQIYSKNPTAAAANNQAAMIMKYSPLLFGVIYIGIPAGVNVYFVVSSLFRIGQQELMWRHDPVLRKHSLEARQKMVETKALEDSGQIPKQPKQSIWQQLKGASQQVREAGGEADGKATPQKPRGGAPGQQKPRTTPQNRNAKRKRK